MYRFIRSIPEHIQIYPLMHEHIKLSLSPSANVDFVMMKVESVAFDTHFPTTSYLRQLLSDNVSEHCFHHIYDKTRPRRDYISSTESVVECTVYENTFDTPSERYHFITSRLDSAHIDHHYPYRYNRFTRNVIINDRANTADFTDTDVDESILNIPSPPNSHPIPITEWNQYITSTYYS